MIKHKFPDISSELLLQPYHNGVRLFAPNVDTCNSYQSVSAMMSLPVNVFFMTGDGTIQNLNEKTLLAFKRDSKKEILGKKLLDLLPDTLASKGTLDNNNAVIKKASMQIFNEEIIYDETSVCHAVSFKLPWFDSQDNLIGIFGFAIMMDNIDPMQLAQSNALIWQTKLFTVESQFFNTQCPLNLQINGVSFTKREIEVLKYLIRGKTSVETGKILNRSSRTVERHLENCRAKAGVNTRSELIDFIS